MATCLNDWLAYWLELKKTDGDKWNAKKLKSLIKEKFCLRAEWITGSFAQSVRSSNTSKNLDSRLCS